MVLPLKATPFWGLRCLLRLIDCEAVEVASSTRGYQIGLAAASGAVCAIPGCRVCTAASSVEVAHLSRSVAITSPVVAGVIRAVIDKAAAQ